MSQAPAIWGGLECYFVLPFYSSGVSDGLPAESLLSGKNLGANNAAFLSI